MQPEGHLIPADTELLLRLGNGDKHAFDILYNRYWKQVFNAAYKRLGDREQAQDIAQDDKPQRHMEHIDTLQRWTFMTARERYCKDCRTYLR